MMRLLSAIILGGSLVIGAFLMRPARYEGFPVEVPEDLLQDFAGRGSDARVHGVFDRRTGEVCYRNFFASSNSDYQMTEVAPPDESETARCPLP